MRFERVGLQRAAADFVLLTSHFDYISNRQGNVYSRRHYAVKKHPVELDRKSYLLEYFEDYMSKTLLRDVDWTFVDTARTRNMDFLVKYYRMKNAIVFKMSNDVLQVASPTSAVSVPRGSLALLTSSTSTTTRSSYSRKTRRSSPSSTPTSNSRPSPSTASSTTRPATASI